MQIKILHYEKELGKPLHLESTEEKMKFLVEMLNNLRKIGQH